jgi:acyl carrier protein
MERADLPLRPNRIAIVGLAFRFPGGEEFWPALCAGRNLVSSVEAGRWSHDVFYHPRRAAPGASYTVAGGSLGDVSGFDAAFFGISPREAANLDPQQRLLLELSWEAFESAGIPSAAVRGSRSSVHIGFSGSDYGHRAVQDFAALDAFSMTGIAGSIAANRLSYFYDLRGPSMAVDTACSSSLVAVHQACQSLLSGEAEFAVAGAVNLHLHPMPYIGFSKAGMLSPRGVCSPFDAEGDGYVRSEGAAIVLLKRLEDAVAAGNRIHAVIAGSCVNSDGKTNSLTVPSGEAQVALLSDVYSRACIDPAEIDYIEAHGTGTAVGDPIEARALSDALGKRRGASLRIGSVKSNVGHLETASGMAGLVKAVFCLRERVLPPSINFRQPNPNIALRDWNLEVVTETTPLDPQKRLVIGVNSFGFGGANAHVILESAPPRPAAPAGGERAAPLVLSARSEDALKALAQRYAGYVERETGTPLYDVAYSAAFHRDRLEHRAIFFGEERAALARLLADFAAGNAAPGATSGRALPAAQGPVFVYSGNASQWPGMGKRLLAESEVFAAAVASVDALFREHSEFSLREALGRDDLAQLLEATEYAQPLLFAVQVGLTEMLRDWGIRPTAVMGHSVGEIAAAWACNALSLEQAVQVVYCRSACQARTRGAGAMTAVGLGAAETADLLETLELGATLCLAAVNSPQSVTVAGPRGELERFEAELERAQVRFRRLALDYAFHSSAMDPIGEDVRRCLASLAPRPETLPFYSTVDGERCGGETLDAAYWWRNIREAVQFSGATQRLVGAGANVFVEIGPHPVLRGYLGECLKAASAEGRVLATMTRSGDGAVAVRDNSFQVLAAGCASDLARLFPERGRLVDLPGYPWQRERYWHKPSSEAHDLINRRVVHPLLGYRVPGNEQEWENHIDTRLLPALGEHRVGGQVVVAAAAFAEMALAAAADAQPGGSYRLEELEIRAPLVLDAEHAKTVRLRWDPADGSFTIRSRDRLSHEAWRTHVTGRISAGGAQDVAVPSTAAAPAAGERVSAATHYRLTAALGLEYGPAFQQVSELWRDGSAICATLRGADGDRDLLLARAIDGCFQLLIHALRGPAERADVAFVPVRIERLDLHRPGAVACAARFELVRRGPRSVVASGLLRDADGAVVASLAGIRFRAVQLRKASAGVSFLEAQAVLKPVAGSAALPVQTRHLAEVCRARLHTRARLQARERYFNDVEPLLEAMLAAFASEALAARPDAAQIEKRLVDRLTELAGGEDYPPGCEIWSQLLGEHPDHAQEVIWLGRVGFHLTDLLGGAAWSAPKLPLAAEFAQPIADVVGEAMRVLPPGRRLRVAVVDAGHTPSLPRMLEQLDPEYSDCVVLCVEPSIVEDRKALAARYPGTVVRALDAGSALPAQAEEAFDFVVLEDGLGWAPDPEPVLALLARLAAERGMLVIAEQRPSRAAVFAAHLLAIAGSPDAPRLAAPRDAEQWHRLLARYGFGMPVAIPDTLENEAGSFLLLARAEGRAAAQAPVLKRSRWILLADAAGASAVLGERVGAILRGRGQEAWVCEPARLREHLHEANGVVYLGGLGEGLERQPARCAAVAELLEIVGGISTPPATWLVTAASHRDPGEAPLWGFGRVAQNEYRHIPLRLADLAEPEAPEAMAQVLAEALLNPDAEDEMILSAAGRYVPRFQPVSLLRAAPAGAGGERAPVVGLEAPPGGQIKNLCWTRRELRAVAEGEVEIEVRAAGLNFRDVMFAMGQLTDEALENGFSGPGLGMEVAGVVLAAGAGANGLRPGDEVIAFAPSGFSTRVLTHSNAVVKKPAGWSFEAAATIPTTFLTAYYALHHLAQLEEGQRILIHGAAGGVGLAAIQLAQMAGAEVFATAGSDVKRDVLRMLGVEHVLDSRSLAFADEVMARSGGKGIDVVLNSLAGEAMSRSLGVLKPFGRFLELGKRDFYENTRIGLRPLRNNIAYFAIDADQLMLERPELTRRLLHELMMLFKNARLTPLPYRAFAAADAVEAFRYMQQSKQIGKVVLSFDPPPSAPPAPAPERRRPSFSGNATYLVTGGLRGFGLKTAQWLAARGARHLLLVGRSAPDTEAQAAIAALEAGGTRVRVAQCDVADAAELAALLAQARAAMPPLRGVVHAAAVISDGLIRGLTAERIAAVLAPKARGAANLDRLTRADALDFFVLYSSATTLFGNPGQAGYVGANYHLEVLAAARRAQGLPALCVSWGPIGDAGYLARHPQIREALESRIGGSALDAAEAFELLEQLLAEGEGQAIAVKFDRGGPSRMLAEAASPKFGPLLARFEQDEHAASDGESLRRWLEEMNDEELEVLFTEMVKKEIGDILRMPADKLEVQRPLQDLGLDSLMGVELMTAIEARFGVNIPVMAMSEIGTIERLVKRIVKELHRRESGEPGVEDAVAAQVRRVAAQHAAGEVADEQLDALAAGIKVAPPANPAPPAARPSDVNITAK